MPVDNSYNGGVYGQTSGQELWRVYQAGQKERYVHFSVTTAGHLRDYLEKARPDSDDDHLFLNKGGHSITPAGLYELVTRKGDQAGVPGATVHRFRHFFALSYLQNGGTVVGLQRALGHESPVMSLWYASMVPTDGAREHREASPVERLGLKRRR